MPEAGREVLCKLQHADTKRTIEYRLLRVKENDCDWNVIEWEDT